MRVQDKLNEAEVKAIVKTRNDRADRLIENWSKRTDIVGKEFQEKAHNNMSKFRNLAIVLENTEQYLSRISETVISSNYQMMPQNVMRVVRLGYGNSIRGEIFNEWAMETMRDSIWYVKPTYKDTLRDGVAGTVTHETSTNRYSSEIEIESLGTGDDSTNTFTPTMTKTPIRPYKVFVLRNDVLVAQDDGSGIFEDLVTGTLAGSVSSTITYASGAVSVTFASAPLTTDTIQIRYLVDTEVVANYDELGPLDLVLTDHQFRPDVHPLEVSWSKKSEFLIGTTLDTSIEDTLTIAAAQELKKSADFRALREGYRNAKSNTLIQYNADWKSAGANSLDAHAQTVQHVFSRASNAIYSELQRGGVSAIYGGADAIAYLELNRKFVKDNKAVKVGGYKYGTLDGTPVFMVPSNIVPNDELVTSWVNEQNPTDVGVSIGVFLPMATTDRLTFKNLQTEYSIFSYEDIKTLNSKYCRRIKFLNLSSVLV